MANLGYRFVSTPEVEKLVVRLTRPTEASRSWAHDYDAQGVNLAHLKSRDPMIHKRSRSVTPKDLEEIVEHLHRPTTASTAKVHDFDNQDANLYHLKTRDEKILLPFRSMTPSTLRGAQASASSRRSPTVTVSIRYSARPNRKNSCRSTKTTNTSDGSRIVSDAEMDGIVERLGKPTISTLGGAPIADKKFEYIQTPKLKTLPLIPGLDTKYMGSQKVNVEEFDDIVLRLVKPTKATVQRSAPDPHTRLLIKRKSVQAVTAY